MMSNKPSSEFIRFYSYRGKNYKDEILAGMYDMFLQEISRIQTVRMRNLSKNDPGFIKNFDTNGRKFCLFPFLNAYLEEGKPSERKLIKDAEGRATFENNRLATLLHTKLEGKVELTSEEDSELTELVTKAIHSYMEERTNKILNGWEKSGILEEVKKIKNITSSKDANSEEQIRNAVENFIWNDNFASKNILQLTIGDIAFYKDAEDLQKRLAELHAPGIKPNKDATDFNGNRVSDGIYRTFVLKDFDEVKSNIIDNITEVFDRKIAAAPEGNKKQMEALKEALVGEKGKFRQINLADAQGFSSPSSRRKKAFMFGKWSQKAEDVYQKLLKEQYTYTDLEVAFQPEKPFCYGMLHKNVGANNSPIQNMPVPFQAKNSEYLLIMADAILQGESLSKPNMLRAIYQVMENSEKNNPTRGIDTVQFESAVKSGLQGKIDLSPYLNMPNGTEAAIKYMEGLIYKEGSTEYNIDTYVHETDYSNYGIQQEVPEHFKNHAQVHGSQVRAITISDLDIYKDPNGDLTDPNNRVYYEFDEPDGTHKKLTAEQFRLEFENNIYEGIKESIVNLVKELHLDSTDKKERNIALSKLLQREILSSPRYGIDLLQACSIDKETGEFRIPKGDPIQAKRIEQLINSIIKSRVNKQKIAGGPIVQVSNFGTSKQLSIRFKDKNGNLLMSREEYEQSNDIIDSNNAAVNKFNARYGKVANKKSYENYIKENQAGIAYFECFIPVWANEVFDYFQNLDGTIDVKAIEEVCPDLLKMVGYRIPTEAKYSCAPLKAVGFLPPEAGDAVMFPADITTINDSDFDIDKEYIMRKDIPLVKKSDKEIREALFKKLKSKVPEEQHQKLKNLIYKFVHNPELNRDLTPSHRVLWNLYKRVAYTPKIPTKGKKYRDNKTIDMTWCVLTHETSTSQILATGGFDDIKKIGYMVAAYKSSTSTFTWEELQNMSIEKLKKLYYTEKDLTFIDTQIQFYKQNSAAASLIGIFAVARSAQAILQHDHLTVAIDELCGEDTFIIAGMTFAGHMPLDQQYTNTGELIGKILGSFVAASADAVKDPVMNLMNINITTVNILNTLLRLGMNPQSALTFLSQNIITKVINEYNKQNLSSYCSLSSVIDKFISKIKTDYNITENDEINQEALTEEELQYGLLDTEHDEIDYKVLKDLQKIIAISNAIKNPTFATRFNSISSAVGPLIIDNLIIENKIRKFLSSENEEGTHIYDNSRNEVEITDIFNNHPILNGFKETVFIAAKMFSDMPIGSSQFRTVLNSIPEEMQYKFYGDRKLLSTLADFYQSYILVASGLINPSQLSNYVNGFPEWFIKQGYKDKYKDIALIQAIQRMINKKGKSYLSIKTTGMDAQQKELLSIAWIDLQKKDPILSQRLITYNFFRAGIGFNPKTFTNLIPTPVKEKLQVTINSKTISYVDTFRHLPQLSPTLVFKQFIQNNWQNNKIVPKKGGKGTHYDIDMKTHTLYVRDKDDYNDLYSVPYMKTSINGVTHLWARVSLNKDNQEMIYKEIPALGGNNDYLEISTKEIIKPLNSVTEETGNNSNSDIQETTNQETNSNTEPIKSPITSTEKAKRIDAMVDAIMKLDSRKTEKSAKEKIEDIKNASNKNTYRKYLQNIFKTMNIDVNENDVLKEFEKYC